MTQKQESNVAMAEQLVQQEQSLPGLEDKAMKLRERLLVLVTAVRFKLM